MNEKKKIDSTRSTRNDAGEVFAHGREDVYQDYFLIEHRRAVPATRREMKNIARLRDALLFTNGEEDAATLDEGHLFVRVIMRGRDNVRRETQATDHQSLADNHLPLDACFNLLHRNL